MAALAERAAAAAEVQLALFADQPEMTGARAEGVPLARQYTRTSAASRAPQAICPGMRKTAADKWQPLAQDEPIPLSLGSEQAQAQLRLLPAELVELSQEQREAAVAALTELMLPLLRPL